MFPHIATYDQLDLSNKNKHKPGSILSAAVDVGSVLHQVAYDPQPAAGARLVQGAVPGVVSVVNVTDPSLQTVQHHLLDTNETRRQPMRAELSHFLFTKRDLCYLFIRIYFP